MNNLTRRVGYVLKHGAMIGIIGIAVTVMSVDTRSNVVMRNINNERDAKASPMQELRPLVQEFIATHYQAFDLFLNELNYFCNGAWVAKKIGCGWLFEKACSMIEGNPVHIDEATILARFLQDEHKQYRLNSIQKIKNNDEALIAFITSLLIQIGNSDRSIAAVKKISHHNNLARLNLDQTLDISVFAQKIDERSKNGAYCISNDIYFPTMAAILFVFHLYRQGVCDDKRLVAKIK